MIKHLKYSKGLHVLILCCFLLPFFNKGCEKKSRQEMEEAEMAMAEKIAKGDTVIQFVDSNYVAEEDFTLPTTDSTDSSEKVKDELLSLQIVGKFPILKPVLTPDEHVYTGLATVIDSLPWITFIATPISFLFLLVCLTTKIIDKNARRTIVLLDILAFGFLVIAQALSWECERLWGIWVTISLVGTLTLYDIYINRLIRKQLKADSTV